MKTQQEALQRTKQAEPTQLSRASNRLILGAITCNCDYKQSNI